MYVVRFFRARVAQRKLRSLLPPVALCAVACAAAIALAVAAYKRSPVLAWVAAVALVASVAGAMWFLMADRVARRLPRHVAWREDEWREFERSFWAYVKRRSDAPPRFRPGRDVQQ
jgi:hypothetical protein